MRFCGEHTSLVSGCAATCVRVCVAPGVMLQPSPLLPVLLPSLSLLLYLFALQGIHPTRQVGGLER